MFFICFNNDPPKMMKNAFYFFLKAFFVLKIFKFLYRLFGHAERVIRKIRLILKFMTSQFAWQTTTIHILPNTSPIQDKQTMKFGQLVEYNKRNTLLQKSCRKWGKKTSPRPLFVFKKALCEVKASGPQLGFTIFQ